MLLITLYHIWKDQKRKDQTQKEGATVRGAVNQFLLFQKTVYIPLKLVKWVKVLVCENNSSGTSSPFMVTDCLGKLFTWINVADNVSEKITQKEQSPLIRRQVV